ncbi:hypothetical protein [Metapseudomonas furukawaii]|uniref:Uncharacterized protein n=1 Tax=Metapseudomonas furukawaii TaxID=1149133 RepID=A0AAD1C5J9_METFU|nr:hypothetical protein [Pseudomonas furukawaii]ELS27292.1 hypothetical protein ppKF707_4741 [Pseudomonas furukawaii]BAU76029.1 hypothetical protein KF707C_43410 [Pseudomonas furukawaii]
MNPSFPGTPSAFLPGGRAWLLGALLLATGCAHDPDIRASRDGTSGMTTRPAAEYLSCVKEDVGYRTDTFTEEEDGKTLLYVGSTDPNRASGLVELSSAQGGNHFSVRQRSAWQDKGRLINVALMCSKA